jgi:hypothetical protein
MKNDLITKDSDLGETLREVLPPVLMAFGALSLLRMSRTLSLVALGIFAYDVVTRQDAGRVAKGRDAASKRVQNQRIDEMSDDSFPASDPPSSSGSFVGAP